MNEIHSNELKWKRAQKKRTLIDSNEKKINWLINWREIAEIQTQKIENTVSEKFDYLKKSFFIVSISFDST